MVSFRIIATAAIAFAAPIFAQTTPAQVVTDLNTLAQQAKNLQPIASQITTINAPLIVIGQGPLPKIIIGLSQQVNSVTTFLSQMEGMPAVAAGAQSDAIYKAYLNFSTAEQALLNILIGKTNVLTNSLSIVGAPMAAVLRQDQSALDAYALKLIANVPSYAADLTSPYKSLDKLFQTAVEKYSEDPLAKRSLRFGRRAIAV